VLEGKPVSFTSPREALDFGIARVLQDLAMIRLLSITRIFSWAGSR
jgi:simple sugar transport system ATP-binding protein